MHCDTRFASAANIKVGHRLDATTSWTLVDCHQEYTELVLFTGFARALWRRPVFPDRSFGRPYVIRNFVSTLDGVVSYNIEGSSGGRLSAVPMMRTGCYHERKRQDSSRRSDISDVGATGRNYYNRLRSRGGQVQTG